MARKANQSFSRDRAQEQQFWQMHLEAYAKTALKKSQYCRQHQLAYPRFIYWYSKSQPKTRPLVPVTLIESSVATKKVILCTLELANGHRLLVYDATILPHILAQLH